MRFVQIEERAHRVAVRGALGFLFLSRIGAVENAPALLRGYLDLTRAIKRHIDRRIAERINLAVHEWLSCDYCLVAHTRAARKLGVPDSEILLARQGTSRDPAIAAIVAFAQQVLAGPAEITDADIGRLHERGYRDEQLAECRDWSRCSC